MTIVAAHMCEFGLRFILKMWVVLRDRKPIHISPQSDSHDLSFLCGLSLPNNINDQPSLSTLFNLLILYPKPLKTLPDFLLSFEFQKPPFRLPMYFFPQLNNFCHFHPLRLQYLRMFLE